LSKQTAQAKKTDEAVKKQAIELKDLKEKMADLDA